jgi:GNAT superfamily N-acetyltransferase
VTICTRLSRPPDRTAMLALINAAAQACRGVISVDRWHEPYMPAGELDSEIADGVVFRVAEQGDGTLLGVMGVQDRVDIALIRHAYVAPAAQRRGVGTRLLHEIQALTTLPLLVGTWADARWAVDFYRRNGFTLLAPADACALLRRYWSIPERQIETSVVLADQQWLKRRNPAPGL